MDGFRVPLNPKWYLKSGCLCTPENGFLYASNLHVVHISPIKEDETPDIKILDVNVRTRSLACDPDWSDTKYFAVLSEDNSVYLWDLNKEKVTKGHNILSKQSTSEGAICFTSNKKILSTNEKQFVNYCVLSNKYVTDKDFLVNKHCVSILKPSPYEPNIIAVGTKKGLILIANYTEKTILYNLRGHDTEIVSLDWMFLKNESQIIEQKSNKELPVQLSKEDFLDSSEIFDIYAFDELENEFGTIRDQTTSLCKGEDMNHGNQDVIVENDNFNFIEACKSLKDDILGNSNDETNTSDVSIPTTAEIQEQYEKNRDKNPSEDESDSLDLENLPPSPRDDSEKNEDFIVISSPEVNEEQNGKIFLASGSREPVIWIWDTSVGTAVESIKMKTKSSSKSALPSTYIVLSWVNESTLISNNTTGDLIEWNIKYNNKNNKFVINSVSKNYIPKAVIGLCSSSKNTETLFVWTVSVQRQIHCTKINDNADIIANYHTLCPNIMSITECPFDMNKLAIGCVDKRICILNLSNLKTNSVNLLPLMNKIQSKILSMSWHPLNENLLGFSTSEGRVGIFDANKLTNVPIIMKPFCGKPIYSISWGKLSSKNDKIILFACGDGKLVYFSETGDQKHQPIEVPNYKDVTTVSAGDKYVAIGTQNGLVHIADLDINLNTISTNKISNKYVSRINWNPFTKNVLAISTMESNIYIFDCSTITNNEVIDIKTLSGHLTSVVWVKWSNNTENKLVSTSYDGTVRVWDTKTLSTISVYQYSCIMFCAMFSPVDDNIIICSGHDKTIEFFDSTKHNHTVKKLTKDKTVLKLDWATQMQLYNPRLNKSVEKKIKAVEQINSKESVAEISETLETLKIENEKCIVDKSNQKSIFYLSNKQMNKEPLLLIKQLLDENQTNEQNYCKKLFSKRTDVIHLLEEEFTNIKNSSTTSAALILIPQIKGNLREEILEKIEKKILTEEHLALAPMIGFTFWKSCCKAYAVQCLDNGNNLQAIKFLLVCHELTEAIEWLCQSFYFREAFALGKMHFEEEHPLLKIILTKWLQYLDQCGHYGAAALINICNNNYEDAATNLKKFKIPNDEIKEILEILSTKINAN